MTRRSVEKRVVSESHSIEGESKVNEKVVQALREARRLIETPNSWVQGHLRGAGGRGVTGYCMLGAIEEACKRDLVVDYFTVVRAVENALLERGMARVARLIVAFNDRCGRTHSEVLEVFDKAIAREESRI